MPAIYEQSMAQAARELIAQERRAIKLLGDGIEPLILKPENIEHLKNTNTPKRTNAQ